MLAEHELSGPAIDQVEQCSRCKDTYPWAVLTTALTPRGRVMVLCARCAEGAGEETVSG